MSPRPVTNLLVVEDDDLLRQTLTDMLELNHFPVRSAATATEGLALADRQPPDLIITDLNLPGMSGFELLGRLGQDEKLRAVPVIVLSARTDRASIRRGMELGAADYITKPFTEHEVLRSINARLEKKALLDELDAFSYTVAHDLKNPLTTLIGRLELIGSSLPDGSQKTLRPHVDGAVRDAFRLDSIIEELLTLAGVRRQNVRPEPLDMAAIVAEALDRLDSLLRQRRATVVKPGAWPPAVGHAPWLVEVWMNLISNAAVHGGSPARITLGAEPTDGGVLSRFWVRDEGPGMDEAVRATMFAPFNRITTVRAQGHGLGLPIVRRIVEKLHGEVGVESRPGAGARFWFELPVTAEDYAAL